MQAADLLEGLLDLAREVGLEVRRLPGRPGGEGDLPARSGACRLRDRWLVWLAPGDSVEDRIDALVQGLRSLGPGAFEGRWIPPAVRARLQEPAGG